MHEDFDMSTMADAWKGVDSCLGRLRETWNMGEEQAGRIATPTAAITPLNALFSESDYPSDAIQANQSGGVKLLLLIDEAGTVQDCTLIETSGIALLDSRSCAVIVKGAKFKPATDVQGRPMKSSIITVIKWMIAN